MFCSTMLSVARLSFSCTAQSVIKQHFSLVEFEVIVVANESNTFLRMLDSINM